METAPLVEGWVRSGPLRLHYIDNQGSAKLTPLVIVPGFAGIAEDFGEIVRSLAPRRCVSMSLRGRGRSDTPSSGYSLRDHAGDIASLVAGLGFKESYVMAHSRGVPYAIEFARTRRESVMGLILLDYPARHSKLSPKWVSSFLSSDFGRTAVPARVRPETVRGVQEDSDGALLWEALDDFDFPALIIRGGKEGSLLKGEDADLYSKHLADSRIIVFDESGHDQWKPDMARFVRTIYDFLAEVEEQKTTTTSSPGSG